MYNKKRKALPQPNIISKKVPFIVSVARASNWVQGCVAFKL